MALLLRKVAFYILFSAPFLLLRLPLVTGVCPKHNAKLYSGNQISHFKHTHCPVKLREKHIHEKKKIEFQSHYLGVFIRVLQL